MPTLNIRFDKSAFSKKDKTKVWIGFWGTGNISMGGKALKLINDGYKSGSVSKGNWYPISKLIKKGVTTTGFSGRIYICYGSPWVLETNGLPSVLNSGSKNYRRRFDKFEITFDGSPYGVADLTAIDFWSIPVSLKSTLNNQPVGQLEGIRSGTTAQQLFDRLKALSNPVQSTNTASELTSAWKNHQPPAPKINPTSAVVTKKKAFVRVVAPNTYPSMGEPTSAMFGLPFTPYNTFEAYFNHLIATFGPGTKMNAKVNGLGNGKIAHLKGNYGGSKKDHTNAGKAQTYDLEASIAADMSVTISGLGSVLGNIKMQIPKWELLNPAGSYGGNPSFHLDGSTKMVSPKNNIYGWICGDFFAGLNIGTIGSAVKIGNIEVGSMDSSTWFSQLKSSNLFGNLWPNNADFYNQWAAELINRSDAYNFAYSERFSAPQLSVDPQKMDTLHVLLENPAIIL